MSGERNQSGAASGSGNNIDASPRASSQHREPPARQSDEPAQSAAATAAAAKSSLKESLAAAEKPRELGVERSAAALNVAD